MLGLALPCAAHATDTTLATWRDQAQRIRVLAENDVPRALEEAVRLEAALSTDAPPGDRARMLNLRSRIEAYLGWIEDADRNARLALELAKQHDDRVGQAEAGLNLALTTVYRGDIDGLIAATTHSVEVLEGIDRADLLGEALLRTAMMYRRVGQVEDSVTMCMQAMEIARRSNDPLALAYAHQGLAISFSLSERRAEAREHYGQMRDAARSAGFKLLEASALASLGQAIGSLDDPDDGELLLRESVKLHREVGAPLFLNHALFNLANHLRMQGMPERAQAFLDEMVERYQTYPTRIGMWHALVERSANHQALGDLAAALADAERSREVAGEIGLPLYLVESAQRIAAVAAAQGNHRRAYQLFSEAAEVKAGNERETSSARMIALAERYESESKQRAIQELTRRNTLQDAELRQQALRQRLLWTVLGGSLVALLGTGFFLMRLRHSHYLLSAANTRLLRSENDVRVLNTELEARVQARTAELRQQTRYLRALIDALPWWVWLKDTHSRYLAVNQAAAVAAGLPPEELVGKSDLDLHPPEMAAALREDDIEVMTSRTHKTIEEPRRVRDHTIWMETYKAPVLDEDGTVLGTVGFVRDISEHKATEAAREAALAEAERLVRLRGEFMAQMSHELRTPLNGILGYAQLLRRDKTLTERQLAWATTIQQSAEHLHTLINDILDFTRMESGRLVLYPVPIQLDKFLRAIAEIVRVRAEQKLLRFVCDTSPDLPRWVQGDEKRLRQVLLNLLGNAVKFTDRGEVRLAVSRLDDGRLRFEVRDTGIGIACSERERVFEPFEQAGEMRRRAGGAGLGLPISRQFVRLMGSDIGVESALEAGSTFWFELDLPPVPTTTSATRPDAEKRGYPGPRRKILVVDDVVENRNLIVELLDQLGFEVLSAASAAQAFALASGERPDLVLMDIVMPEVDGLEATRRLRLMPGLDTVPIVAISASASGGDARQCLEAGMNAFLPKPLDLGHLLDQIGTLLHIEWVYDVRATLSEPGQDIVPPPPEVLESLHRVVLQGNMRDIIRHAAQLAEGDSRYHAFSTQVRLLAEAYQSKALLRLVEQHLTTQTPP